MALGPAALTGTTNATVLHLAFTITPEDLVDASRAYSVSLQRKAVTAGGVVAVIGLLIWLLTENSVGLVVALFGVFAMVSGRVRFVDRWLVLRTAAHRVGKHSEFRIDDVGIHHREEGMSGSIEWFTITEIREDERSILFLQGQLPVAGIPKRAFASPEEIDLLRRIIKERAPTARHTGGPDPDR